ncbi:FG-GAP-like repeat-containing protein [Streptomyces narbonensis]|uniref:FG-GAP-like repeat-containing protein n=1 Tax=Streptomyces narbonensis TaxID=67333 RepID=UPI00340433B1
MAAALLSAPQTQAEELTTAQVVEELRVISWNVCGEAGGPRGSNAYCPRRNEPAAKAAAIASLAAQHDANVLLLQEVCGYDPEDPASSPAPPTPTPTEPSPTASSAPPLIHLDELKKELGPKWNFAFAAGNRESDLKSHCRGSLGGHQGVALAVKGNLKDRVSFDTMPKDSTTVDADLQKRVLPAVCGRLEGWPDRLCSAHLIPGGDASKPEDPISKARTAQIAKIYSRLENDFAAGLVIGGDLNASETSPTLAGLTTNGLHRYVNSDHTRQSWAPGAAPHTSRLDHIYTSKKNRFTHVEVGHSLMDRARNIASVTPSGWSDHAPVIVHIAANNGDLTGDGRPDLLAVENAAAGGDLRLYPGTGTGDHGTHTEIGTATDWTGASVTHRGDWTGDGLEDVIARIGTKLYVYPNRGGGKIDTGIELASGLESTAQVISIGDLEKDGYRDLIVRNESGTLLRYDGKADGGLEAPVQIGNSGWGVMDVTSAGDATGDGYPDIWARNDATGSLSLYPGGDGTKISEERTRRIGFFDEALPYGSGYGTSNRRLLAGAADANGDDIPDMWTTASTGTAAENLLFYPTGVKDTGQLIDTAPDTVGEGGWQIFTSLS